MRWQWQSELNHPGDGAVRRRGLGAKRLMLSSPRMSLNGNSFKFSARSKPCPECKGYPPLKPFEGRLRPECPTCDGRGSVPRALSKPSPSESDA